MKDYIAGNSLGLQNDTDWIIIVSLMFAVPDLMLKCGGERSKSER